MNGSRGASREPGQPTVCLSRTGRTNEPFGAVRGGLRSMHQMQDAIVSPLDILLIGVELLLIAVGLSSVTLLTFGRLQRPNALTRAVVLAARSLLATALMPIALLHYAVRRVRDPHWTLQSSFNRLWSLTAPRD